jgi:hypothetical protein
MNNMQELYQSIKDAEQQLNKLKKLKELLEQLKPDTIQPIPDRLYEVKEIEVE